ncbi:Hypothetical predicted protein [Cloeon dipterum]|uniref:Peptidase S1 domain-containing protein n=1 Tax=Cloeon dipterum TaxID=197152 RepID=A0A8S1C3A6_9INSE|nr:Hypothetical predicted protein [Cloeon dipterum]
MRFILATCLLFAVAQATDWADVRPARQPHPPMLRKPNFSKHRIIGGENAVEGQFKYQVAVLIEGAGFCGGSLIADDIVLTAGHCINNFAFWEVHAGALNFDNLEEPGRVVVSTNISTLHENYNGIIINNDIGILKLSEPVSGPNIAPIRLPSWSQANTTFDYQTARVSGWGKSSDNSTSINVDLKFVDLKVISQDDCLAIYGPLVINENKLCCDADGGASSTCNGDSGGPLVITEEDGEPTEIGIVSFGVSLGCESGWPAAFTRITYYLDWLAQNAGVTIRP